jgi:hypothetical protein
MIQILVGLGLSDVFRNLVIGLILGLVVILGLVAYKKITGVDLLAILRKKAQARASASEYRESLRINPPAVHHMTLGPQAPVLSSSQIRIVEASRGRVIMEVSGLRITLESVLNE